MLKCDFPLFKKIKNKKVTRFSWDSRSVLVISICLEYILMAGRQMSNSSLVGTPVILKISCHGGKSEVAGIYISIMT